MVIIVERNEDLIVHILVIFCAILDLVLLVLYEECQLDAIAVSKREKFYAQMGLLHSNVEQLVEEN